ncbi:MAG: hypothetical protein GWO44_21980, partial [Thermoplasmata archaeon]|nr:hypothetical protein [Thermoplasmata archaeon]NIY05851.1 hypothetical protein [Thermoplasmata archaeon]
MEVSETGGPGGVFTYDMGEGNLVEIDVGMGTGKRANELQINWAGSPSSMMRAGTDRVGPG